MFRGRIKTETLELKKSADKLKEAIHSCAGFVTGLKCIADACENAGIRYEFQKKIGFVAWFYRELEKVMQKADKKLIKSR